MTPPTPQPVRYRLDLTGKGHELHVTVSVPSPEAGSARFWLPSWAPGSYLVREFARHVDAVRAVQGERDLPVRKSAKDEWTVEGVVAGSPLQLRYRLYARELTVRTNYLADDRALLCGAATFVVPEGRERGPFRVEVACPPDWPPVECALPREGDHFVAPDLDSLLDAPIAAGPCRTTEFTVRGVPHRVAVYGEGDCDPERLVPGLRATCEAAADVFGGEIPLNRYLFIVELGCTGGLEHANSSVCGFPVQGFATGQERRKRFSLLAHEYFHLWNVKRIRPKGLGPFDYRHEVYTPHLWLAEGVTSYYQHLLLLRAQLLTPERYLAILASYLLEIERTPGRFAQSLEESSHDAWIKYYRPDENSRNMQVSYYGKGAVAGLVLDLEIRRRTDGKRSLDDVFRELWRGWKRHPDQGYSDAELLAALAHAAGEPLDAVLEECVRRRDDVDVDGRLAAVGLRLDRRRPEVGTWLGASLRDREGRLVVEATVREGPAWDAGVAPADELIALDGFRVGRADLGGWLAEREPGTVATLTTARWGRLREVEVTLGVRPPRDYRFRKLAEAGPAARHACESWLGLPWDRLQPLEEPQEDQAPPDRFLEA